MSAKRKILAIGLVGTAVLTAAGVYAYSLSGSAKHALAIQVARARKLGLATEHEDLIRTIPKEQNAAPHINRACELLETWQGEEVLVELQDFRAGKRVNPPSRILAKIPTLTQELEMASSKPHCEFVLDPATCSYGYPSYRGLGQLPLILCDLAREDLTNGDTNAAFDHLDAARRIAFHYVDSADTHGFMQFFQTYPMVEAEVRDWIKIYKEQGLEVGRKFVGSEPALPDPKVILSKGLAKTRALLRVLRDVPYPSGSTEEKLRMYMRLPNYTDIFDAAAIDGYCDVLERWPANRDDYAAQQAVADTEWMKVTAENSLGSDAKQISTPGIRLLPFRLAYLAKKRQATAAVVRPADRQRVMRTRGRS